MDGHEQGAPESAEQHAHRLLSELAKPSAFPQDSCEPIEVLETHISWIFLTAKFAYKVKRPIANAFIDYSTLERRKFFCEKELELDSRFAAGLYVDVQPIAESAAGLRVGGSGRVYEYCLRMVRFAADALLAERLAKGLVRFEDMRQLAEHIAQVHAQATAAPTSSSFGEPSSILADALDNLDALDASGPHAAWCDPQMLAELRHWTLASFESLRDRFHQRKQLQRIRECHGDLHTGNILHWQGSYVAFDGIEFNEEFRWIDTLSDVAFLVMDLIVHQHPQLARELLNSYLEFSGDYASLELLRWYLLYRGLVRAKVAAMVLGQQTMHSAARAEAAGNLQKLMSFAGALTRDHRRPKLWITHGVSGSGKSTRASQLVRQQAAIRIRADVERKRLAKIDPFQSTSPARAAEIYGEDSTLRTYERLHQLASQILTAGYSVVVDATFLKRAQRARFEQLATDLGVPMAILDCQADLSLLQRRIAERQRAGGDPSDADVHVLHRQLATREPLTKDEQAHLFKAEGSGMR